MPDFQEPELNLRSIAVPLSGQLTRTKRNNRLVNVIVIAISRVRIRSDKRPNPVQLVFLNEGNRIRRKQDSKKPAA